MSKLEWKKVNEQMEARVEGFTLRQERDGVSFMKEYGILEDPSKRCAGFFWKNGRVTFVHELTRGSYEYLLLSRSEKTPSQCSTVSVRKTLPEAVVAAACDALDREKVLAVLSKHPLVRDDVWLNRLCRQLLANNDTTASDLLLDYVQRYAEDRKRLLQQVIQMANEAQHRVVYVPIKDEPSAPSADSPGQDSVLAYLRGENERLVVENARLKVQAERDQEALKSWRSVWEQARVLVLESHWIEGTESRQLWKELKRRAAELLGEKA